MDQSNTPLLIKEKIAQEALPQGKIGRLLLLKTLRYQGAIDSRHHNY